MSKEEVAKAFVAHFFSTLSTNAGQLAGLYHPVSVFTCEGNQFVGPQAIIEKYSSLGQMRHNVLTTDCQTSLSGESMLIVVTGQLLMGDNTNPLLFSQVFQLVATGPGQYYVHNDLFRLIIA